MDNVLSVTQYADMSYLTDSILASPHILHIHKIFYIDTEWAKNTELTLRVNNFATVDGRRVCDMSKISEICLEKNIKLARRCI